RLSPVRLLGARTLVHGARCNWHRPLLGLRSDLRESTYSLAGTGLLGRGLGVLRRSQTDLRREGPAPSGFQLPQRDKSDRGIQGIRAVSRRWLQHGDAASTREQTWMELRGTGAIAVARRAGSSP